MKFGNLIGLGTVPRRGSADERQTYCMDVGIGRSIWWWQAPDSEGRGRVHGFLTPRPQPGDRIIAPMQSGRRAIFEVEAEGNKYPFDPPDQFFLSVLFAGYEDETPEFNQVRIAPVREPVPSHDPCGCPTNRGGDIACHKCGEMVNVRCWKCGTPRGEEKCPSSAKETP